jgi:hypothetical protein
MLAPYGIKVPEGLDGAGLVQWIIGLGTGSTYDMLSNPNGGLNPTQLASFQGLLSGIINLTTAIQDNTNSIDTLTGQNDAQSWSSTAWQMYRQAIFNGSGGLAPNIMANIPHFANGGIMQKDGLAFLHGGERVLRKDEQHNATVNVNIKEADMVNDPTALGNQIAFILKHAR